MLYTLLKMHSENHLLLANKKSLRTTKPQVYCCDQLCTLWVKTKDVGHNCRAESCTETLNNL